MVISLDLECIIAANTLGNWSSLHIEMWENAVVRPSGALGIPSALVLTVNQKQYHIPRRIAKINANTRDLKEAGVAIPNISI